MPEEWDFRISKIEGEDLGEAERRTLIINQDTASQGPRAIEGTLSLVPIDEGIIKDVIAADPTKPRRISFKVAGALFKGRFTRFGTGKGLMWGHVIQRRPPLDDDEGEVWVATKGGGTILDERTEPATKAARKKPKTAAKKKAAKRK